MPLSHCTKCGTRTTRTDTDPGTYSYICPVCSQVEEFVIAANDAAEISVCPVCGKTHIAVQFFDYLKFTTSFGPSDGAFAASITGPSASTVTWQLYDGETTVEQTGLSCSYTFTTAGPHEVRCICDLDEITALDAHACGLTDIDGLGSCGALTALDIKHNEDIVFDLIALPPSCESVNIFGRTVVAGVTGSLSDVSACTHVDLNACASVDGDLSSLAGAEYVNLWACVLVTGGISSLSAATWVSLGTNTTITGDLADFADTAQMLNLIGCTGIVGFDVAHMTNIGEIYLRDQSADQTRVNAIIDNIYTNKESFTDTTITMNIDGNNAAPSAAQILKIEELQADYGWSITYTIPS